jgi:hypothetical protein
MTARFGLIPLTLIAGLAFATVWLGIAVVKLEKYRYANFVGMCTKYNITDPIQRIQREDCLEKIQTRTHWFWHLIHGLKVL